MSTTSLYLVPKEKVMSPQEYAEMAKAFLLETEIIMEPTDGSKFFVNGERSWDAFEPDPDPTSQNSDDFPFDSVDIFSGPHFTVVPDEYVDANFCPRCGADIGGEWSRATLDEDDNPRTDDLREVRVVCPTCNGSFRLDEVSGETVEKFYLTDRYICFLDAQRSTKAEWVAAFDRQMGCHHEVLQYWW